MYGIKYLGSTPQLIIHNYHEALVDELQDRKNGMEEKNQEVGIWEEIWFVLMKYYIK